MALDRKALDLCVDELTVELSSLARRIHAHPELCFEERQAAAWLGDCLERELGTQVERGVGGLETAFRARVGSGS
ncbi:MAG: M20 family peptidase, partial [Polyangiaceae bacterium]